MNDHYYSVPGIITATKKDNICGEEKLWSIPNIAAPCGKFSWIGGSVTGHNIDMNPA